jgi:hypothetical protein
MSRQGPQRRPRLIEQRQSAQVLVIALARRVSLKGVESVFMNRIEQSIFVGGIQQDETNRNRDQCNQYAARSVTHLNATANLVSVFQTVSQRRRTPLMTTLKKGRNTYSGRNLQQRSGLRNVSYDAF